MNPPRRRLPVWIWDRFLAPTAALCGLCNRTKLRDGRWHVCRNCDRAPASPLPPNYR